MKISIVIPTYECHGRGVEFLDRNFEKIFNQSYENYEVVVSDHSMDDNIAAYCAETPLRNTYVKYLDNRGNSSANLNNAIRYATGDIIKPMFQDDYLFDKDALKFINERFEDGCYWLVCGNNTSNKAGVYFNDFKPRWNDDIIYGRNTLSSPSCLAYVRCDEVWDERLIWLMDCEFYFRLYKKWGFPFLENRILVTNFAHPTQYTHLISYERKKWEVNLMKKEHGKR